MRGMFFIPDNVRSATSICRVIAKGNNVQTFIKVGDTVLCQKGFADRESLTLEDKFFCNEDNIFAVIIKGSIFPVGRKILIRRDVSEKMEGLIIIPENRRFQSLFGRVERFGITRKSFQYADLVIGDYIRLTDWNESMIEVELEDGNFGLIVNEKDILYKIP